jgi:Asp-tRNA(Asn)/Glu-tRNA(Gln) amidotransferase A subunit family amidase
VRPAMPSASSIIVAALVLPAGFTEDGRPVGIQIAAPPQCEHRLLSAATMIEDALGIAGRTPVEPNVTHLTAIGVAR